MSYQDFIIGLLKGAFPPGFSYLELGVWKGEVFERVAELTPDCVGVDVQDLRRNRSRGEFVEATTREFFHRNTRTFDFVFIDASHNYLDVREDLSNAIRVLKVGGIIALHDTDPSRAELIDDTGQSWCGDAYKIVDYSQELEAFDSITLPIDIMGLTLLNRKADRRVLAWRGSTPRSQVPSARLDGRQRQRLHSSGGTIRRTYQTRQG